MEKNFKKGFLQACAEFAHSMGPSVPSWFIDYLKQTRCNIEPATSRTSVKVESWQGHSIEEIEAYLHALHMSPAGTAFNCLLAKHTGYWMMHQCGCDDCFYPATAPRIVFPSWEIMGQDYEAHVDQQKRQMGIAA